MTKLSKFKTSFEEELKLFVCYATFLMVFFSSFTLFFYMLESRPFEFPLTFYEFGYDLIQALIFSKIILLGQYFHLGDKYNNRPLIVPTLVKTLFFSLLVIVFSIGEEFVKAVFLKGHTFNDFLTHLYTVGFERILAKVLIMFFVFIFFFAFLEIGRVMGEKKLLNLFFKNNS